MLRSNRYMVSHGPNAFAVVDTRSDRDSSATADAKTSSADEKSSRIRSAAVWDIKKPETQLGFGSQVPEALACSWRFLAFANGDQIVLLDFAGRS